MTDMPMETRPALSSLTLRGAAAMAVAFGLSRLGVALPVGAAQAIADAITELTFYAGLIAVGVGRARAHARVRRVAAAGGIEPRRRRRNRGPEGLCADHGLCGGA